MKKIHNSTPNVVELLNYFPSRVSFRAPFGDECLPTENQPDQILCCIASLAFFRRACFKDALRQGDGFAFQRG